MWHIEYGAEWADSYEIWDTDWDRAMRTLSNGLANHVDRRLITPEQFTEAMEWVTGVVIDDEDVRTPAQFDDEDGYGLSVAITRVSDED